MYVQLVLWNLADSLTTVDELRRVLEEELAWPLGKVEGLRTSSWLADELGERWGAVLTWDSEEASRAGLPERLGDVIGKPPEVAEGFDLVATIDEE
jgi:hypothetical protein